MSKTIEEKFKEKGSYILELPLNEKYKLFVEGLSENGEAIQEEDFNVNNIKKFCVEIINAEGEALCSIDASELRLYNSIEKFTDLAKERLEVGTLYYHNLYYSYCIQYGPNPYSDYNEYESYDDFKFDIDYYLDEDVEELEKLEGADVGDDEYIIRDDIWIKYYDYFLEKYEEKASEALSEEREG